ncbi:dynamin [Paenibacillus beijingensis]|uniref:Dynamin n=2 Tax=Paenibacillus beijingensis TaxID=1126833 RepID=A0A0D5NSW2_9BACL|nr:dynamin [Paenibacillus beijingensis]
MDWMEQAGYGADAARVAELAKKLLEKKLTVAFCGHFSAGKSTLVNSLCGADLLPSSPIPTSANVVSIRGGEPARAVVTALRSGNVESFEAPPQRLDDYCKDGEQFLTVDIVYPAPVLGSHTVLLDTPGIDSTDDAHRLATESALHLADVVFYVMDYNHVQSEINFAFAKRLKDWGKPLYLIVNQIDKHRERELSFAQYRRSVEKAFRNWSLEPSGIMYLSLRQPDHPHNQREQLESLLGELAEEREQLGRCSVYASVRHLGAQFLKRQEEAEQELRRQYMEAAGGIDAAGRIASEMEALRARIAELESWPHIWETSMREEVTQTLDNANVVPAATRDLAHSFLESRKPGFKTGFLFAGSKTAAEQQRRLEAFRSDLAEQTKAAVVWHLTDLIRRAAETEQAADESFEHELEQSFSWRPTPDWLLERVNTGAVFGNEYTMTYCRDVAAGLKAHYRRAAYDRLEAIAAKAAKRSEAAAEAARTELAKLGAQAEALCRMEELDRDARERAARLEALLPPAPQPPKLPVPGPEAGKTDQAAALHDEAAAAEGGKASAASAGHKAAVSADASAEPGGRVQPIDAHAQRSAQRPQPPGGHADPGVGYERQGGGNAQMSVGHGRQDGGNAQPGGGSAPQSGRAASGALAPQRLAAERLTAAAELLASQPSLASAAAAMRTRAARLRESRFTIALFGAFSAGKSSLANALIGARALPVSPNPTTAAINRIAPPAGEYGHGTARVLLKSPEAMLDDMRYSLALLGEEAGSGGAGELLKQISRLSPDGLHAAGRPHYSFLKAAEAGWDSLSSRLGSELVVDETEYRLYVADESRSCFVREIELYYSSPLTDQGVVLVDTPGADSVNARHTGVAFNYIKNADAVLFVTYYNHAFSQADRQFLMQLGRVKDQFELDKMFFLVNAADLASSQEELGGVLAHVESNLLQHGIRFPRLYPVSSMLALDGKEAGDAAMVEASMIGRFERSFNDFTQHELGSLAIKSAEQEIGRARDTIREWIEAAEGDAAAREEQREALSGQKRSAEAEIEEAVRSIPAAELEKERQELLYYVLQRVQYRFGEFFAFAFNPSVLRDDGRDLRKAVWTSWLELQRMLQTELSQELLATTLRMGRTVNSLAGKRYAALSEKLSARLTGFRPSPYEDAAFDTPEETASLHFDEIDAKWLNARFKSPRSFFEGEGSKQLRSELEAKLAPSMQLWIQEAGRRWQPVYESLLTEMIVRSAGRLREELDAYADGKLLSLQDNGSREALIEISRKLQSI